ncbi:hypothetical protein [Streptomyces sp. NPDC008150]|uniref:DUF7352 domain-containing protein n=1 Tax=Streptomyces sp. NPDC008150 TaxID=3364816 RepID=UPI0036E46365
MTEPAVIHRVELPIDDRPHGIDLTGVILHVASRRHGYLDVWYQARPADVDHMRRAFQVVGTGQPIPAHLGAHIAGGHKGTAITPDGQLVWHLLESYCSHQNVIEAAEFGDQPGTGAGICQDCPTALRGDGEGGWLPV